MTSHICRACYILQTTAQGVLKLELLLLHSSRAYALVHYVARGWSVTPSACSRFDWLTGLLPEAVALLYYCIGCVIFEASSLAASKSHWLPKRAGLPM